MGWGCAQAGEVNAGILLHRLQHFARLECCGFKNGARDVALIRIARQAADDAKAIEALADQFELNPDGTFTDASIQKVYNLTPAKYLKTIRDVVDNHQESAFALNKERNDAKQKYIQSAAKDVAAFVDDPAAQSTMFLTKLGLMKKSGVITDNEVQQALQLVVSPDRTGDTPITGAINPNRLNMQLNA